MPQLNALSILTTTECHPLAKQAKDLSAGAVLIFAIVSAIDRYDDFHSEMV